MRSLIGLLLYGLFTASVAAAPLKNIVIFGDSLSDNGNLYEYMNHALPKSPPYYKGHFSNGPIWAEHLLMHYFPAKKVNAHLLDYAFGGAGVMTSTEEDDVLFTLNREIDTYLLAHADRADPDSMFVVWIGGNNYLGLPDDVDIATSDVRDGIQKGLEKLVHAGARHITLMNLPDLGKTPFARTLEAEQVFHDITTLHNQKLETLLHQVKQQMPGTQFLYFDVDAIFNQMFEHPENYPFQNLTEMCESVSSEPTQIQSTLKSRQPFLKMVTATRPSEPADINKNGCNRFFFFDLVHPTTPVHALLATHLIHLFEEAGITFN